MIKIYSDDYFIKKCRPIFGRRIQIRSENKSIFFRKINKNQNKVNKFLSFLESHRVRGYRRFLYFYHFSQQLSCRVFWVREKRFSLRYFRIRRFLQAPQLRTFSLLILWLKKDLNLGIEYFVL